MFKVFVGPQRRIFHTHEAVLSQSPVFECMCNGSFKEGVEREIELPDDNADAFECLIEYLCRGISDSGETANRHVKAGVLANVYIMAEKYQLDDLKSVVIASLVAIFDNATGSKGINRFFDAARKIYENTPDSESLFPDCFKQRVTQIAAYGDQFPYLVAQVKCCISHGGKLAQDTFDAYILHAATAQARLQRQHCSLQLKHDTVKLRLEVLSSKVSTVKASHRVYHGKCHICDLLLY